MLHAYVAMLKKSAEQNRAKEQARREEQARTEAEAARAAHAVGRAADPTVGHDPAGSAARGSVAYGFAGVAQGPWTRQLSSGRTWRGVTQGRI